MLRRAMMFSPISAILASTLALATSARVLSAMPRAILGDFGDERLEVVVLGDEVGLAVDFDHEAALGVGEIRRR
jgi:hypothetical protein